ncbi:MAG: hypothetical protein IJ493_02920 [Clostridia bacterium]|nr:hypothetical protein [Clostridia bacterium]
MDGDFSSKLNQILGDPEALARLMSVAGTLLGGGTSSRQTANEPSVRDEPDPPFHESVSEAETALPVSAEPLSEPAIAVGGRVSDCSCDRSNSIRDKRCALLFALKPFLRHGRAEKVDLIVKLLQFSDIAGNMFGR